MVLVDVVDGAAVGNNIAAVIPFIPQDLFQQRFASAAGFSVDAVIGAHDRRRIGVLDAVAERPEIGIIHRLPVDLNVRFVAGRFGTGMNGKMLDGGVELAVGRIVSLKSFDKYAAHASG